MVLTFVGLAKPHSAFVLFNMLREFVLFGTVQQTLFRIIWVYCVFEMLVEVASSTAEHQVFVLISLAVSLVAIKVIDMNLILVKTIHCFEAISTPALEIGSQIRKRFSAICVFGHGPGRTMASLNAGCFQSEC